MTSRSIEAVLAAHTPKLMSIPGVVGQAANFVHYIAAQLKSEQAN